MEKKRQKQIVMNVGDKQLLVRQFNTTYFTVRQALEGKRITPLHLAIRAKARELGGVEIGNEETVER